MPEDFVPTTSMERAYVQARKWPADRAWRRAYVEMEEGQLCAGIGMYLCLLDHYARREGVRELFETCEWLLNKTVELKPAERLSVCRIVCHVVKSLKEDEFDLNEARLKLILRIPLAVILEAVAEQRLSCALTGLLEFSRVFEESLTLKRCSDFEGDFRGVAVSIDRAIRAGRVRDDIKESEERTLGAIDAAEQRIKAWKEYKAQQEAAQSASSDEPTQLPWPEQEEEASGETQVQSSADKPTSLSKLSKAESDLEAAIKSFGVQSAEVAHRIADLIEVKSECFPDLVTDDDFKRLSEIVSDGSVDISPYVLRKILAAVGSTDERKNLLSVLTVIEEAVLLKREEQVGLDISLGITLWRLICLWRSNDCLPEGTAYCEVLQRRLLDSRGPDDPVVRQILSAIGFLSALQAGNFKWQENFLGAQSSKTNEAAEFVAMLSTMALDEMVNGRHENAERIMNELLWFYTDTVGDTTRLVGRMLWLLQETSLNKLQKPLASLVHQSQKFASDIYLKTCLMNDLRRIFTLTPDEEKKRELLSCLLLARETVAQHEDYESALAELKKVLALTNFVESYDQEAEAERRRIQTPSEKYLESATVITQLEKHATKKQWKKIAERLNQDRRLIDVDSCFYRLVCIGVAAARANQVDVCKKIAAMLHIETTPTCIRAFNFLIAELKMSLMRSGSSEEALEWIAETLCIRHQTVDSANCLRLQLAELEVMNGNLFESTALIYQAFMQIPEPWSQKDPPLI